MTSTPDFERYLQRLGLVQGTIDVYLTDLKQADLHDGFLARLLDDKLAPKTRRHILAAGRHYAQFTRDQDLQEQLRLVRLPPARRRQQKIPMAREDLLQLVRVIRDPQVELAPAVRATLGLMACRGLRVGDVIRLERPQVTRALETGVLGYQAKGRRYLEFRVLRAYREFLELLAQQGKDWTTVGELLAPGGHREPKRRRAAAAKVVERALGKLCAELRIWGVHPHRLRRTYAVQYLQASKGDPEAAVKLQQHMRWASIATALEYVDHDRGAELDDAADRIFLDQGAPV